MRRRIGFDEARRVLVDHPKGKPIPGANELVAQAQAPSGLRTPVRQKRSRAYSTKSYIFGSGFKA